MFYTQPHRLPPTGCEEVCSAAAAPAKPGGCLREQQKPSTTAICQASRHQRVVAYRSTIATRLQESRGRRRGLAAVTRAIHRGALLPVVEEAHRARPRGRSATAAATGEEVAFTAAELGTPTPTFVKKVVLPPAAASVVPRCALGPTCVCPSPVVIKAAMIRVSIPLFGLARVGRGLLVARVPHTGLERVLSLQSAHDQVSSCGACARCPA